MAVFWSLQLNLPTSKGIEELLGMGSQAINEYVELNRLTKPMHMSLSEQPMEVVECFTK